MKFIDFDLYVTLCIDKTSQLYNAMAQLRCLRGQNGHRGKHTENVGHRQQQRHLKELRYLS